MPRKKKELKKPKKMTGRFVNAGQKHSQDGCSASPSSQAETCRDKSPQCYAASNTGSGATAEDPCEFQLQGTSYSSPHEGSPARSRQRMSTPVKSHTGDHGICNRGEDDEQLSESINSFPANNQPVSDSILKDMLVSLRGSILTDMKTMVKQFRSELHQVDKRVSHIEHKMEEFASTFNDMVDAHNSREDEIDFLKTKLADLEDRSRRNNLKIRGIPETVTQPELMPYIHSVMKELIPDVTSTDCVIDRIHRIPKPNFLPEKIPRDVLMRVHFFHVKEKILKITRNSDNIPPMYSKLQFFADLSQHTLASRKKLIPITKALRNHKIPYRWGYPTKLIITRNNEITVISEVAEGLKLLKKWNILPMEDSVAEKSKSPEKRTPEWRTPPR